MAEIATTKMSSKGQIVIPETIREKLGLKPGSQFIVLGDKDIVILKSILAPSLDEFDSLISQARKQAKKVGLTKKGIAEAIVNVRGKK